MHTNKTRLRGFKTLDFTLVRVGGLSFYSRASALGGFADSLTGVRIPFVGAWYKIFIPQFPYYKALYFQKSRGELTILLSKLYTHIIKSFFVSLAN
ncbi:hypothetical protein [Nostoc piscinale]|uniref:hypothetical protein n=1 Tax=Nostoc piscinale TaxID=224012 RepID=UPI000ADAF9B3|nr:hypothetical protein [Nostoc piscinale]